MSARRGPPIDSRAMGCAALFFGVALAAGGLLIWRGAKESRRILETGTKSTATVVSKQHTVRNSTYSIEIRVDDRPRDPTVWRILRRPEWEALKEGDRIPYTYDPAEPLHGVLEPEIGMRMDVKGWFFWGSFLVIPFVLAGLILRIRERKKAATAQTSGG